MSALPPPHDETAADAPGGDETMPAGDGADLTGRDRLAWNVFASWAGYAVMVATGFLAPRIMDRQLGQESVGIWDFGWSLVGYFGLAQLGVGSAINRYVARYRARGDVAGLNRVVSSVTVINATAGLVALALTGLVAWQLPRLIHPEQAGDLAVARWVVILLGLTVTSELTFQAYHGVLSGCHRFDIQNGIITTFDVSTSLGIIVALYAGGSLVTLGVITLGAELATEATRFYFAHRVCPELRIRPTTATWDEIKDLLRFGIKSLLAITSALLLIQANKLIVGTALGLATLAIFSRPLSLIKMIDNVVYRFAFILTPAASSLQGTGRKEDLRQLFVESTRLGLALALPMAFFLVVMGDLLVVLWMGPRYHPGLSVAILALGFAGPLAMRPASTILLGANLHGRPALAAFAGAVASVVIGLLSAFVFHWGLTGAALAVAVPSFLSSGVFIAVYAARQFEVSAGEYLRRGFRAPLLCCLPFLAILVASRLLLGHLPVAAMLLGGAAASTVLAPLYWRHVLPDALRTQIRQLPRQLRSMVAV